MGTFIFWRLGFKQSSLRHVTRSPTAPSRTSRHDPRFPGMLLSPFPFGSRSAIGPRNLPSSSSRLCRGYNQAPRGAHLAFHFGPSAQQCLGPGLALGGPGRLDAAVVAAHHDGAPASPGGAAVPQRANFTGAGVEIEHGGGPALVVLGPPGVGSNLACRAGDRPGRQVDIELGKLRGEVPAEEVLFRAAPLRTTRASFDARGSPVIYAVLASGVPLWTTSWQG